MPAWSSVLPGGDSPDRYAPLEGARGPRFLWRPMEDVAALAGNTLHLEERRIFARRRSSWTCGPGGRVGDHGDPSLGGAGGFPVALRDGAELAAA